MDRDHCQQIGHVESDIESDEEDDDNSDTSKVTGDIPRQHAEDAFSSSSEDDDVPPLRRQFVRRITPASSEFDKALLSGIPSIGAASFDGSEFTPEIDMTVMPHPQEASEDGKSTASDEMSFSQVSRKTKISRRLVRFPAVENSLFRSNIATNQASASTSGLSHSHSISSQENTTTTTTTNTTMTTTTATRPSNVGEDFSNGVLPDVLMSVRQKIESMSLFDSDMMKLVEGAEQWQRESLKRSTQQSLSAAVLVSLAHKRYERRRLAAMEIEKVVRGLVQQQEIDRIRSILLLLSDDYVRSTSEDARKGGVVALAACGIGLKKAGNCPKTKECRDLILASVVHACQDHSQRVRYYATESLFNVVKINPTIAVQHFFILFEILRSLFADVDVDVRSGAELLDKKLKEVIVGAINSGSFSVDACVPIFGRFIYMRNKATQRLTLTWLQELNEKLVGNPVLEFLHLFLGGIFAMIADPNNQIRQSALAFLQSVLPKLLMTDNQTFEDQGASMKMDFDKLIQSLVTTLEHPDPFVRKVAMYWMSRIVKAYIGDVGNKSSPATISVRNSVPHVLPGILLSIGDTFHSKVSTKDSFLPDQTTHSLAQQTNICLQTSVKKDGNVYVTHLDGFIVALREELDSPGRDSSAAIERKQYRLDMTTDGSGIESTGWFRVSKDRPKHYEEEATSKSRLCALEWITVLYEYVVPDVLKADVS
jgi:Vacuolar 14 Fab1-binding region